MSELCFCVCLGPSWCVACVRRDREDHRADRWWIRGEGERDTRQLHADNPGECFGIILLANQIGVGHCPLEYTRENGQVTVAQGKTGQHLKATGAKTASPFVLPAQ